MHVDVEFWEDPISQKYTSVQFHGAYNIKGNMDIRIMSVPEKETSNTGNNFKKLGIIWHIVRCKIWKITHLNLTLNLEPRIS